MGDYPVGNAVSDLNETIRSLIVPEIQFIGIQLERIANHFDPPKEES